MYQHRVKSIFVFFLIEMMLDTWGILDYLRLGLLCLNNIVVNFINHNVVALIPGSLILL